jgi:hypothetical protein
MLGFDSASSTKSGAPYLSGPFTRPALTILFSLMLALDAAADTVAETAGAWGLIGSWSLDCSVAPDRGKGAVLAYEIAPGDRVIHRRDFGDTSDESEVMTAEVSGNGMLNLRVFFPRLKQTREYGFVLEPDGTLRAVYNRSQQGQYTIRNGKFTANGNPTMALHKCM